MLEGLNFLKGLLIGVAVAAPLGPIGMLCIRRTLHQGRLAGFATGLGAATADTLFGSVAVFGITMVSAFLVTERLWVRAAGGAILCLVGLRMVLTAPRGPRQEEDPSSLVGDFGSSLVLTLTNPVTILSFAAIYAAFGVRTGGAFDWGDALLLAGVFLGSSLWFTCLSTGVGLFRRAMTEPGLHRVNRITGTVLLAFGVFALLSGAGGLLA